MSQAPQAGRNLPSLTSLRSFVAGMVACFHASQWVNHDGDARGVGRFGFVGVAFFFMLSGFVLT